ncbi:MAG: alcohol dehydrogenase catalytic domain-containing protein [Deltaproteobacteria bacterium]|nr:alcohol dehydrogenase catalytic domain-containing protein [Deltaproteobacteria bacterium]
MKQIVLNRPGHFEVQTTEKPSAGEGMALIRINAVGICGSDMHLYRKGHIGNIQMTDPLVIGHECMGQVEAVGEKVPKDLIGRRVAVEPAMPCGTCRWCKSGLHNVCPEVAFLGLPPTPGAMQEYLVHPAHLLERLPDSLNDAEGVIMEPLAIALHGVRLAKVKPGQTIVILGTGVIGTCVMSLLGLYDHLRIVCVDLLKDRLARAEQMGATQTVLLTSREPALEGIMDATDGLGADIVFECAGTPDTLWLMCEAAGPAGHIAAIGSNPDDQVIFSSGTSRRKGLTIRCVRRSLNTLDECIRLAAAGKIDVKPLVTHTFPASKADDAFRIVESYGDGVLKTVIDMKDWK